MVRKNIIFFGSGWYTLPIIEKLIPHGLDLVITTEKDPNSPFIKFCREKNIKTVVASKASEIINHQSSIINHSIAVLASYGALIPNEIIATFPEGIINIHPSLLPKYKGPSPIQYQLLNGEETVGVTLIKLDDQVDHGPILAQKPYILQGDETSEDLLSILFEIGGDLVVEQIEKLENGEKLTETPQNHSRESWSYRITKEDGHIDIYKLNAKRYELNAMVRAYYPWPGVWFRYSPTVIPNSDPGSNSPKLSGKIIKLLPENHIQVEGKNPMNYKDFVNGFGEEGSKLLQQLNLI